ncbi:hypothetical protein HgNV_070 [Homarus gammarus nudivirus]|uniref:Uncharacterized protein n=1 Tax=Homarus gammarus nudivirus TaxID=2509616 RepID=A0A411HB85_9VIRU|nr:hypothetical protein KM727_gp70 [Homarus gammarus nudivirus]QBB28675.1 hypothetical protein HgNV_070 [Homarus gammarus nudivirus]
MEAMINTNLKMLSSFQRCYDQYINLLILQANRMKPVEWADVYNVMNISRDLKLISSDLNTAYKKYIIKYTKKLDQLNRRRNINFNDTTYNSINQMKELRDSMAKGVLDRDYKKLIESYNNVILTIQKSISEHAKLSRLTPETIKPDKQIKMNPREVSDLSDMLMTLNHTIQVLVDSQYRPRTERDDDREYGSVCNTRADAAADDISMNNDFAWDDDDILYDNEAVEELRSEDSIKTQYLEIEKLLRDVLNNQAIELLADPQPDIQTMFNDLEAKIMYKLSSLGHTMSDTGDITMTGEEGYDRAQISDIRNNIDNIHTIINNVQKDMFQLTTNIDQHASSSDGRIERLSEALDSKLTEFMAELLLKFDESIGSFDMARTDLKEIQSTIISKILKAIELNFMNEENIIITLQDAINKYQREGTPPSMTPPPRPPVAPPGVPVLPPPRLQVSPAQLPSSSNPPLHGVPSQYPFHTILPPPGFAAPPHSPQPESPMDTNAMMPPPGSVTSQQYYGSEVIPPPMSEATFTPPPPPMSEATLTPPPLSQHGSEATLTPPPPPSSAMSQYGSESSLPPPPSKLRPPPPPRVSSLALPPPPPMDVSPLPPPPPMSQYGSEASFLSRTEPELAFSPSPPARGLLEKFSKMPSHKEKDMREYFNGPDPDRAQSRYSDATTDRSQSRYSEFTTTTDGSATPTPPNPTNRIMSAFDEYMRTVSRNLIQEMLTEFDKYVKRLNIDFQDSNTAHREQLMHMLAQQESMLGHYRDELSSLINNQNMTMSNIVSAYNGELHKYENELTRLQRLQDERDFQLINYFQENIPPAVTNAMAPILANNLRDIHADLEQIFNEFKYLATAPSAADIQRYETLLDMFRTGFAEITDKIEEEEFQIRQVKEDLEKVTEENKQITKRQTDILERQEDVMTKTKEDIIKANTDLFKTMIEDAYDKLKESIVSRLDGNSAALYNLSDILNNIQIAESETKVMTAETNRMLRDEKANLKYISDELVHINNSIADATRLTDRNAKELQNIYAIVEEFETAVSAPSRKRKRI